MINNHLKIAWRTFFKDRQYTILNLAGLTTALAGALFILLWVNEEWKVDKFHRNDAQLYQVLQRYPTPKEIQVVDWSPSLLASTIEEEIPEVKWAANIKEGAFENGILQYGTQSIRVNALLAGEKFLELFSFPLIKGEAQQVIADKYAIVLTTSKAIELFGSIEAAMGQSVAWEKTGYFDYKDQFTVTGILEDLPPTSSLQFDAIFNIKYYLDNDKKSTYNWDNNPVATYVVLDKKAKPQELDEKITALVHQHSENNNNAFFLKQYSTEYLFGKYENGFQAGGRITYLRLFSLIAVLILLIGSINFMNLSTARATKRMNEIGVKKTFGASRRSLFFQFMTESFLFTLVALVLAMVIVFSSLPGLGAITGKTFSKQIDFSTIAIITGAALLTGLFSGAYPAVFLSRFNPGKVLKGSMEGATSATLTRKGLVFFQFAISGVLIIAVLIIYQQMTYIQSKNLGYDRANVIQIQKEGALKEKLAPFLEELKKAPGVLQATNSNSTLIGNENFTGITNWPGKTGDDFMMVNVCEVNYDFLPTFGIDVLKGRDFDANRGQELDKVILNQVAVDHMGLTDPIGQTITFWGKPRTIIGLTDNFQYQSLHKSVEPFIIKLFEDGNNFGDQIWVKLSPDHLHAALENIEAIYHQFNPGYPFAYKFIEADYQAMYESEQRVAFLSKYFAAIAIVISCLGLFGLTYFTAQKRQKEISIRKVLGASPLSIIQLLSKDFLSLVVMAIAVAIPLAWLLMRQWLNRFVFRVDMEWWVFVLAGIGAIFLALLTISLQSLRAANTNPAKTLRSE